MNPNEVGRELVKVRGEIGRCELRLTLNTFDHNVWRGENRAGLIEIVRYRRRQRYGLQYLQEPEFIRRDLRVLCAINRTMPAHDHFSRLTVGE
jgi:hypothetical protein